MAERVAGSSTAQVKGDATPGNGVMSARERHNAEMKAAMQMFRAPDGAFAHAVPDPLAGNYGMEEAAHVNKSVSGVPTSLARKDFSVFMQLTQGVNDDQKVAATQHSSLPS